MRFQVCLLGRMAVGVAGREKLGGGPGLSHRSCTCLGVPGQRHPDSWKCETRALS